MINYIEKGIALHKLINDSGYTLSQVDGVWISDNDEAVQAIIDSYDPLPKAQAEAIAQIKQRAGELIVDKLPEWKQRNLMAETLEIMNSDAPNQARLDEIELLWQYPKNVRAQSDIDEEAILAETDWTLVVADFSGMEAI